ncbi:hypothetical protein STVIR_1719 [Streptomyces viridochromogenes Tue57]|uniref:Uncharacterized protein n=1 Tax=Streptomyces viridochromogenes Tue57 TaxID=1160705 RepID=L8PMH7_STRVR|nr:hypothetical protein STVIR_1719 [Streptomyces viridochromogenes Tue57]
MRRPRARPVGLTPRPGGRRAVQPPPRWAVRR